MTTGLSNTVRYHAVLKRDKSYDGIFYFAVKTTGIYCRPSCSVLRPIQKDYLFFHTVEEAVLYGYQACKRCHPDRLKNDLWPEILGSIDAGAINDKGVHGLAESLHISERHLRRIVHDRTGTSPMRLNQTRRLGTARQLIVQTQLPIIDIAFNAGFSSLRQFNDAFKGTFKTSPRKMRKIVSNTRKKNPADPIALPQRLAHESSLRVPLRSIINY